jgi:hypothetical protein
VEVFCCHCSTPFTGGALESPDLSVLNRKRTQAEEWQVDELARQFHLPAEAMVEFYLNKHDERVVRQLEEM